MTIAVQMLWTILGIAGGKPGTVPIPPCTMSTGRMLDSRDTIVPICPAPTSNGVRRIRLIIPFRTMRLAIQLASHAELASRRSPSAICTQGTWAQSPTSRARAALASIDKESPPELCQDARSGFPAVSSVNRKATRPTTQAAIMT